ncbi:MAG TPA: peptidoglycan DD-metalloendopeptidase family protein, partial [bacterium]|nr:peptidoglycan DD-metalloendopeptidase family protein [bacterium]
RTPEDEVDRPGYFYPPFREGWWYQGATYPGHSAFAVDFNRRTKSGGWLQDDGDPVLAAADGVVSEVVPGDGLVVIVHAGDFRTEYRHMRDILVRVRQKVSRGERIGSIGSVAGSGRSTSPHLHHVHYRGDKRVKMRFYDQEVATSVGDSDEKEDGWQPPPPVMVQGPPPKATWQSAFREASAALAASQQRVALLEPENEVLKANLKAAGVRIEALVADLETAGSRIEILESQQPNLDEVRRQARQGFKDQAKLALENIPA